MKQTLYRTHTLGHFVRYVRDLMHEATDVILLLLPLLYNSECSISTSQTAITTCLTTRVQSAQEDHFIRTSNCAWFFSQSSRRNRMRHRFLSHRTILPRFDFCPFWAQRLPSVRPSSLSHADRKKLAKILAQSRLCVDVKAQRGRLEAGHPSSFSPQGLSSPMLIVIFLSRHCSLLCSPSFLIILSAIYQTMKSQRNKKKFKLVVSLHYGLCRVFWEKKKMFCVFSLFPCRKKRACCL